jgi:hypothetical protein
MKEGNSFFNIKNNYFFKISFRFKLKAKQNKKKILNHLF